MIAWLKRWFRRDFCILSLQPGDILIMRVSPETIQQAAAWMKRELERSLKDIGK